jgi:hypothetical protein
MNEQDLEFKIKAIEEIEFELIMASKTANSDLVKGLERALIILEEIT